MKNTRDVSISEAYALATEEFVSLRGRHQLATLAAEIEARHYGAEFKPDVFVRVFSFFFPLSRQQKLMTFIVGGGGGCRNAHSTSKKGRLKLFNLLLCLPPPPLLHLVLPVRHLVSSTVNSHDGNGQTLSRLHLSRLLLADSPLGRITCRNGRCRNR